MYYVLNFKDHSFRSFDFPEQVAAYADSVVDSGVEDDWLEIINAFGDEVRLTVGEFKERWT